MSLPTEPLKLVDHFIFPGCSVSSYTPLSPSVFLPVFQRDAVWRPSQVCELWDSLLRGIPIPGLVLAPVNATGKSVIGKFGTGNLCPKDGDFLLLDGQQRARALMAGLERIHDSNTNLITQRLWIDLDWPHHTPDENDPTLDSHGLRFGFFLCTQAWPWGHNKARDSRANRDKINKAREKLFKKRVWGDFVPPNGKHVGCFDFQIPLDYTWPVEAKSPIPFKVILEQFSIYPSTSGKDWEIFLRKQLEERGIDIPSNSTLARIAKQLHAALPRLNIQTISTAVAHLDDNELLIAFQRINRNATQVTNEELFFAAIKQEEPACDQLAQQTGTPISPLDVVRGAVIMASQPIGGSNILGQLRADDSTPPIDLNPVNLRSLAKVSGSKSKLAGLIQHNLATGSTNYLAALRTLTETLQYNNATTYGLNDPGLPNIMLSHLSVFSWLPPLQYLLELNRKPDANDRIELIRYVLVNHFFADWHPSPAKQLRDLLDFVKQRGADGQSFPKTCEILQKLDCYKKSNPERTPAWLREIYVEATKGNSPSMSGLPAVRLVLPLTPSEWSTFLKRHVALHGNLPPTNNYGWLLSSGLADDLLMWAQRGAMEEWFGGTNIALLGKLGQPWDVDHIVPSVFFEPKYHADPNDVVNSLGTHLPGSNDKWENFRNCANRFGNKRLWPQGFNRSDGDTAASEKLDNNWLKKGRNDWDVLSQWPLSGTTHNPLLAASVIDLVTTWPEWQKTPSVRHTWSKSELDSFLLASLAGREMEIYKSLFSVLLPGLQCYPFWSNGESGNRMAENQSNNKVS